MAKLLRLHSNGDDSLVGWCETRLYPRDIMQLEDPNAGFAAKEITCIPSPYAHLHIVKRAFQYVAEQRELDGNTQWHKLVSDCLDVGQILFNLEQYAEDFELKVWSRTTALPKMAASTNQVHQEIVNVFNQYMRLEASYGLAAMENIFLLKYIGAAKESDLEIVGGISPLTLFYAAPDDLSYLSKHISFGHHAAFDGGKTSLLHRDEEFQNYLFQMKFGSARFHKLFPELDAYLNIALYEKGIEAEQAIRSREPNTSWVPLITEEGLTVTSWGKKIVTRVRTPQ